MQTSLPLGPHDPADSILLKVSVAKRRVLCSLRLVPIGESQFMPLGFRSKELPSSGDAYSPFKYLLLPYHWSLVETKC